MGAIKNKFRNTNLRTAFSTMMLLTLLVVLIVSVFTIIAGVTFQEWLLPKDEHLLMKFNVVHTDGSNSIFDEKLKSGDEMFCFDVDGLTLKVSHYSEGNLMSDSYFSSGGTDIDKSAAIESMTISAEHIVSGLDLLSPKRKLAYATTSVLMIVLPLIYAFVGVSFCTLWFYKRKLSPPIKLLKSATEHIRNKDLDFSVKYNSSDEMGELCESFETMRLALNESNKTQWKMIEAQKTLQASVAHDLRNPIAIIQGYVEHLQIQLSNKTLTEEKLSKTLYNLESASKRLEEYTDSIREIVQLDEIDIQRTSIVLPDALLEIAEDFRVVAEMNNLNMSINCNCTSKKTELDIQILYRVLENVFLNAVRFAKKTIEFLCETQDNFLKITILDDGTGFSEEILKNQKGSLRFNNDRHMGLGLIVSHTLCQKNGWKIKLENDKNTNGASVTIKIKTT